MLGRSSGPSRTLTRDPLSEILQDLRLAGASYARCELTSPWGIEFPAQKLARFHFVADGECWLRAPPLRWTRLRAGDVALLPHGTGHVLTHRPRGRTKPLDAVPVELMGDRFYRMKAGGAGGAGAQTLLACCSVDFEEPAVHPLLELMPKAIVVRSAATADATLPALLDTMADEVKSSRVGSATVMTRLADVLITRVIRAWVEGQCDNATNTTGWLAAIRDPSIGRALAAVHHTPGDPWSLESLADVARTSRSIFAARFATVVGVPPAKYIARWRMHLASAWLRRDRLTVTEVASRLGYDSEASFSRAFKRHVGVPPSALRRETRSVA